MVLYSKFAYGSQFSGEKNDLKIRYLVAEILSKQSGSFFFIHPVLAQSIMVFRQVKSDMSWVIGDWSCVKSTEWNSRVTDTWHVKCSISSEICRQCHLKSELLRIKCQNISVKNAIYRVICQEWHFMSDKCRVII